MDIRIGEVVFFLIVSFFVYLRLKNGKDISGDEIFEDVPYRIKETMMSNHEKMLFLSLRSVLNSRYDVYPQVNLDKIFRVEYQKVYKYYLGWLRKINQKSVDFLVVEKETQSPVFAIELDDATHEREDRIERDIFVQNIFKKNNFPLIRFNPGQYSVDEVKYILKKYLQY